MKNPDPSIWTLIPHIRYKLRLFISPKSLIFTQIKDCMQESKKEHSYVILMGWYYSSVTHSKPPVTPALLGKKNLRIYLLVNVSLQLLEDNGLAIFSTEFLCCDILKKIANQLSSWYNGRPPTSEELGTC